MRTATLIFAFLLGGLSFKGFSAIHHPQKHTGEAQCIQRNAAAFWFIRPNRELFEMYFDNPPGILSPGLTFSDITYTDDNGWERHFIKATVKGPHN